MASRGSQSTDAAKRSAARRDKQRALQSGQSFVPYDIFSDFIIVPLGLIRRPEIPEGAKLLYGRLARYCNRDTGQCNPSIKTLAHEFGKSQDVITRWVQSLVNVRVLRSLRSGRGRSNRYEFVWQDWLNNGPDDSADLRDHDRTLADVGNAIAPTLDSADLRDLDSADLRDQKADDSADLRTPIEERDLFIGLEEQRHYDQQAPNRKKRGSEPAARHDGLPLAEYDAMDPSQRPLAPERQWSIADKKLVDDCVFWYLGGREDIRDWTYQGRALGLRILDAGQGRTAAEICEYFRHLRNDKKLLPGTHGGPKNGPFWFLTVAYKFGMTRSTGMKTPAQTLAAITPRFEAITEDPPF